MFHVEFMIEKPRLDLLTLILTFYNLSVSRNLFLQAKMRLFGASRTHVYETVANRRVKIKYKFINFAVSQDFFKQAHFKIRLFIFMSKQKIQVRLSRPIFLARDEVILFFEDLKIRSGENLRLTGSGLNKIQQLCPYFKRPYFKNMPLF